ncbi:MAG: hypothetical protein IJX18_02305 [Clostridia bacterium]|nr:hypothetical protein [Clostridia bacterium]
MKNLKNIQKTFSLAGVGTASMHCRTREMISTFTDTQSDGTLMGLSVAHVHRKDAGDYLLGKDFRLNLHERFEKNATDDSALKDDSGNAYAYVYTDGTGERYGFHKYHYKIVGNNKEFISAADNEITVDSKGKLCYNKIEVYEEYASVTGLKATTPKSTYKCADCFDDRTQEEKDLEGKMREIKKVLSAYTLNTTTVAKTCLSDYLDSNASFDDFLEQASFFGLKKNGVAVSNLDAEINDIRADYKIYAQNQEELEILWLKQPVNYLTDGKIKKGFNRYGWLVSVRNDYGKGVFIEYERYGVSDSSKTRIKRVKDDEKNEVTLTYAKDGKLTKLQDAHGRAVYYTYNADGYLTNVEHDTGAKITLEYDNGYLYHVLDENKYLDTYIDGLGTSSLISVYQSPTVGKVNMDAASGVPDIEITVFSFTFMDNEDGSSSLTITEDRERERYSFDTTGALYEYAKEEKAVVIDAERYAYTPYWSGTTKNADPKFVIAKAARSSLYVNSL